MIKKFPYLIAAIAVVFPVLFCACAPRVLFLVGFAPGGGFDI